MLGRLRKAQARSQPLPTACLKQIQAAHATANEEAMASVRCNLVWPERATHTNMARAPSTQAEIKQGPRKIAIAL